MQTTYAETLTVDEIEELRGIQNGADVWGYGNAYRCRSIERKRPDLIRIVPAKENPPGHEQQPYFGAIATPAGRKYLKTFMRKVSA